MTNILLQASFMDGMGSFLPLIGIVIVFYFFFIRPQSKQRKDAESMIDELQKGDIVVTAGGIHGKMVKDNGTNIVMDIATNTKIKVDKSSISLELTKAARNTETTEK